jgi:pimeloyl-ACP methyl ester carboxylesterase
MHVVVLLLVLVVPLTGCIPTELAKQLPFPIPGVAIPEETEAAEEEEPDETEIKAVKKPKKPVVEALKPTTHVTRLPNGLKIATHQFTPPAPLDPGKSLPDDPGKPVLWIIAPVGSRYHDWDLFIRAAMGKGYTLLYTDLRGQGSSSQLANGTTLSWRLFTPTDWNQLHLDIVQLLDSWRKTPLLKAPNWVVVSAGTGAIVTGQVLEAWPKPQKGVFSPKLTGVVFWSPRLKGKGQDATDGLLSLKAPLLLLGNPNDPLSTDAWRVMPKLAEGPVQTVPLGPADAGSLMLKEGLPHVWPWLENGFSTQDTVQPSRNHNSP